MAEQAKGIAVLDYGQNARAFRSPQEACEYRNKTGEAISEVHIFGNLSMLQEVRNLFPDVFVRQMVNTQPPPNIQPQKFLYKLLERIQFYLSNYEIHQWWIFLMHVLLRAFHISMSCFGVRVIYCRWFSGRLGHLAYNTQTLMNMLRIYRRKILIAFTDTPANCTLQKIWSRSFSKILRGGRWQTIFEHSGLRELKYYHATAWYGDAHFPAQTQDWQKHVEFTDEEIAMGKECLMRMGIPEGAQFVCFHARDRVYLDTVAPGHDWKYHDFRDCDIESFKLAAEYLTSEGLYVIRLSQIAEKPFVIEGNDKVIDYTTKYRSDFMDIYLMANCLFLLGSCSGVAQVSTIFGRPVAMTNWVHCELMTCFRPGDLLIPKRHIIEGHEMYLREILDSGAGRFIDSKAYAANNIILEDNTEMEILALSIEMYRRIKGIWEETEQMEEIRSKFKAIINRDGLLSKGSPVMIGMHYAKMKGWLK